MFGVGDDGASDASIFVVVVSSVNAFFFAPVLGSFFSFLSSSKMSFGEEGSVLSKVVFFFFLDVVVLSPPPKGSLLDVDDIAQGGEVSPLAVFGAPNEEPDIHVVDTLCL